MTKPIGAPPRRTARERRSETAAADGPEGLTAPRIPAPDEPARARWRSGFTEGFLTPSPRGLRTFLARPKIRHRWERTTGRLFIAIGIGVSAAS
ncbi:hypothetical protein [Streptomyces olivaceoviridis]|uniref:hypothetical protein n=1 Tax=Streptomyces olivaceoviridis TaxID=1921 RepID=UPI0016723603